MNLFYSRRDTSRLLTFEALQKLQNQHALLIDIREKEAYKHFHLPGFLNYPLSQKNSWLPQLDKKQMTCFICEYGTTAQTLALSLFNQGYNAYSFDKGVSHYPYFHKNNPQLY